MSRAYDITFDTPNGTVKTVRGYGNTKRSAERQARGRLREFGIDPSKCRRRSIVFVREKR